jgi:hypothetical protein
LILEVGSENPEKTVRANQEEVTNVHALIRFHFHRRVVVGQDAIIRACRDLIRNFERKTYLLVTATVSWKYRVSLIDDRRQQNIKFIDRSSATGKDHF